MTRERFLTWRDLPEKPAAAVAGELRGPFRFYFGGKVPEMVLFFERGTVQPFAIGMEGYIRLEKLLGQNILGWPGKRIAIRRGFKGGHYYVEIVPELPA